MDPNKLLNPWKRFVGLLSLEKKDILQITYYAIFSGFMTLTLPLGIQAIINLIQGAQISTSWVVLVILVTLGVAFNGALQLMQLRIIESLQQKIFTRASFELSYRFPKIKMEALRAYYPPELANRFFDTLTIQKGLSKILIDAPAALLQILFALILLSFYHPFFIVFGFMLLALIYTVFKYTAVKGLESSLEESKHKYRVAHWIQEVARSIVSFKLSGKTQLALDKNDHLVKDYLNAREKHFKVLVLQFIQMIGFKVLVTAGLLLIGGALVLNQEMNIGQFVAAEIIIILVISSVEKLILGLESFYDVLTSLEKLGQVVDKELESQKGDTISAETSFNLILSKVFYSVPDRDTPILSDINLEISNQCRILVRGESGSGKSSLLRLLAGIIDPTSGRIFINDAALSSLHLNSYRALLGLSLSEETPFEGTIRENVSFNNLEVTDQRIRAVFNEIGLKEFLKDQPNGLDTYLKPEGKQIAYTVAKKIILARAIIKNPKLLILEDPLDQFSMEEAASIITYITDPIHNWSLIVVSANKQWESSCNTIVNLDNGKIQ
ncbi:ATP-binding cassette domain-containing protein [Flavobacteriaceae bacterium]|nr:ATP-binding cassette domain-containing protein [Flavobacteriaceae bacterium]MDA9280259.1 ATP-binding cassette domain-containing protein [Flavobacteriaceae bacterium]MDC1218578.1 ATP-binding cassette domain-containing protein [Flavobacteriaceae bacterium]MDC1276056.1 ATP-binding cassette domain-containing protein [Flavobacteriaceae bacterium]